MNKNEINEKKLNENQKKALTLIRKRGDEGTLIKDVASALKDDANVARTVCDKLWKMGLVIKKRTFGISTFQRQFNHTRTQKIVAFYPLNQDEG